MTSDDTDARDGDVVAEDVRNILKACKALVERTDEHPEGAAGMPLSGRDLALLGQYERVQALGWLEGDWARREAGLNRSAIAVLEGLLARRDAEADPEGTLRRIAEHFGLDLSHPRASDQDATPPARWLPAGADWRTYYPPGTPIAERLAPAPELRRPGTRYSRTCDGCDTPVYGSYHTSS